MKKTCQIIALRYAMLEADVRIIALQRLIIHLQKKVIKKL